MPRVLQRFVALFLVAVWLPVTLCCTAEAATGDRFSLCAEGCDDKAPAGAERDGCQIVEDGKYSGTVAQIKVSAPAACLCLICLHETAAAVSAAATPESGYARHPRDWVPIWQFERRAAAPAHAPDSLIA